MSGNHPTSHLITLRSQPLEGVKAFQRTLDFTLVSVITDDTLLEIQDGVISDIQSLKIDNSLNNSPLTIYFPGVGKSGDIVTCPANAVLFSPVIVPRMENYHYTAATAGAVKVPVTFLNIELPYLLIPLSVQSSPTTIVTGTEVNHSATLGAGSQLAINANPNRLQVVIQNPSSNNNSMWVKSLLAAQADNTSQEILPGQEYNTGNGPVQLGSINIIGTAGDKFFAYELTK